MVPRWPYSISRVRNRRRQQRNSALITQGKLDDARKADIIAGIPLSRLGSAKDVAGACLFLASDLSAYCTGITLDVNGGMLIH